MYRRKDAGFTIVELLIVIVVIAVLAAIVIVAFNSIQARARTTKIDADIAQLNKAIQAARMAAGDQPLHIVTQSTGTAWQCVSLPSNVDLANKVAAATCWSDYTSALDKISSVSGQNVRNLSDPYGRPYLIDENEGESGGCGNRDTLGAYPKERTQGDWTTTNTLQVPYILPGC